MFDTSNINPLAFRILVYLSRSPEERYLREIARSLGASPGGCHNALKELAKANLIEFRTSGRNLYYQVRRDDPSIIHLKILATLLELKPLAASLEPFSMKIILYGSCSKGEDTHRSDVDMLVIASDEKEAKSAIVSFESSRHLNAIIQKPSRHIKARAEDPAFYREIDKGIVLYSK